MEDISVLYYNNKSKTTIYGDFYNVVKSMTNCSFKAIIYKLLEATALCCLGSVSLHEVVICFL